MSTAQPRTPEIGHFVVSDDEPFGEWELPGMGESAPTCGQVSASHFCDEQGHIHYQRHLCGRRECAECWSTQWAGPRTVSVISRLAAARYAAEIAPAKRCIHAVVSAPEGSINTIRGFYDGRRQANEIAKEHGLRGGVVVAHGYRATDAAKERYEAASPDLSLWLWIRQNGTAWEEQVYWAPHYHVVGLADPESVDPETGRGGHIEPAEDRADGWIFKNVRSLRRYEGPPEQRHVDYEGLEDMAGTVRYLLSHATFPANEDRQAVTWFGALHGTNFDPSSDLEAFRWNEIEAAAEAVVGAEADDDEEGGERRCSVDGCDGRLHEIWGASLFLETEGGELPEEVYNRIDRAYGWVIGDLHPPPGLKNPQTVEQAKEAFEQLRAAEAG